MTDIQNTVTVQPNLEAHYTTETKTNINKKVAVVAPENIPKATILTDAEANKKLSTLNADIFESSKKYENHKTKKKFLGLF